MAAVFALVEVQAGNDRQLARRAFDGLQPAHAAAVELSIKLHYATAAFVGGRALGDRQVLNHTAPPGVGIDLQGRATEIPLVIHPQLLVIDTFTRVVVQRIGAYRARVCLVRCPGLPQWILRTVLLQAAVDQCQLAVVIGLDIELGEGLVAARAAVIAVAVGVHARGVEHKPGAIRRALGAQVVFVQAVAAHQGFGADTRRAFAVAGEHLDHAAGVAAIQRRRRAAQHFDALGRVEVERRGLALAIRGTGGDAVGDQLDAAHAEC